MFNKIVEFGCKGITYYLSAIRYNGGLLLEKWGKRFEDLQAKRIELSSPVKRDLYANLPQDFNRDLLRETIKRLELTTPDWVFLSKWNAKGLIKKISKNQFQKIQ